MKVTRRQKAAPAKHKKALPTVAQKARRDSMERVGSLSRTRKARNEVAKTRSGSSIVKKQSKAKEVLKKKTKKNRNSDKNQNTEQIYDFDESEEDALKLVLFPEHNDDPEISFKTRDTKYTSIRKKKVMQEGHVNTPTKVPKKRSVNVTPKGNDPDIGSSTQNTKYTSVRKRKATEEADTNKKLKVSKKTAANGGSKETPEDQEEIPFELRLFEDLLNVENTRRTKKSVSKNKMQQVLSLQLLADKTVVEKITQKENTRNTKVTRIQPQRKQRLSELVRSSAKLDRVHSTFPSQKSSRKGSRVAQVKSQSRLITDFLPTPQASSTRKQQVKIDTSTVLTEKTSTPSSRTARAGTDTQLDYDTHVLPSPMLSPVQTMSPINFVVKPADVIVEASSPNFWSRSPKPNSLLLSEKTYSGRGSIGGLPMSPALIRERTLTKKERKPEKKTKTIPVKTPSAKYDEWAERMSLELEEVESYKLSVESD